MLVFGPYLVKFQEVNMNKKWLQKKRIFILLLSIVVIALSKCAEPPSPLEIPLTTISGKVVDAKTNLSIMNAIISTDPVTEQVATNNEGRYRIEANVQLGQRYRVNASKHGYYGNSAEVTVEEGENKLADIALTPNDDDSSNSLHPPKLINPPDGLITHEETPTFDWEHVEGAETYHIQVDTTAYFPSPVIDQPAIPTSKYTPTEPLSDGKYYWRVRAKNSLNTHGNWSDIWDFTINHLKWYFQTGDVVYHSPAISSDGTIYVGSWDDDLYPLTTNGRLKREPYHTEGNIHSTPAIGVDRETIHVGSNDHYLHAILPDGTFRWKFETNGPVHSPGIGSNGIIFVGSSDCYFRSIYTNGDSRWSFKTGGAVISAPAIDSDGTIYVGSCDSYLYAFTYDSPLKWQFKTGAPIESSPAIDSDGTVYVGSGDGYLYAINPDGTLKWKYETGDSVYSSPTIDSEGTIYVGSFDGYLYAFNSNGSLKWKFHTGGHTHSSATIGSNGTIYIGSIDGHFYAFNPNGSIKWKYQIGSEIHSSPAIDTDGTIYIGANDGRLYALQSSSSGLANSSWPKFRHDNQNTGRIGGP